MSFIIRSHSLVKLGTTAAERKLFFKMGEVRALTDIKDSEQRQMARKRLAKRLKTSPLMIKEMEDRLFWHDISLDKPTSSGSLDHSSEITFKDFLADELSLEEQLKKRDLLREAKSEIAHAMERLNNREAEIIRIRYLGDTSKTLQSIADQYGLSRERIRQIESRAFDKIRPILKRSNTVREVLTEFVNTKTEEREDVTEP